MYIGIVKIAHHQRSRIGSMDSRIRSGDVSPNVKVARLLIAILACYLITWVPPGMLCKTLLHTQFVFSVDHRVIRPQIALSVYEGKRNERKTQPFSVHGWTSAFLLNFHRFCGAVEGRWSHFLPHWLRRVGQGKIP